MIEIKLHRFNRRKHVGVATSGGTQEISRRREVEEIRRIHNKNRRANSTWRILRMEANDTFILIPASLSHVVNQDMIGTLASLFKCWCFMVNMVSRREIIIEEIKTSINLGPAGRRQVCLRREDGQKPSLLFNSLFPEQRLFYYRQMASAYYKFTWRCPANFDVSRLGMYHQS